MKKQSRFSLLGSVVGPFLALGIVVLFFSVADSMQAHGGAFMTLRNLRMVSTQTATVAVAALGMTVIIIAGGIDLSAGTALALCATVVALSLKEDIAVLIVHGDNLPGITEKLEQAEFELDQLNRGIEQQQSSAVDRMGDHDALERRVDALKQRRDVIQKASERLSPYSPIAGVLLGVLVGGLTGLVNGLLISYLRVVPFIVTLGTMRLYLGISKEIANETTVRPNVTNQVPDWLTNCLSVRAHALWFGLPLGVWLTLFLALVLAAVLHYTVFGRHVFAIGSNEATARLCGINIRRTKVAIYSLAGLFVGVAGLYQFSRLSIGDPTSGVGLELNVIAAVVIGGGSLNGGRGSVIGTLTGAAIMAVITSGCSQLGLRNPVQDVILGTIIVVAVAFDQLRMRLRTKQVF